MSSGFGFRVIMGAQEPMPVKRSASGLMLACGVVLLFVGLSAAMGFTAAGMLASATAIVALLYAGGVWFGAMPAALAPAGTQIVLVFDTSLHIAGWSFARGSVLLQFPEPLRPELEVRCRAALRGEHSHFICTYGGARLAFDIGPVHTVQGMVRHGVLITGSAPRVSNVAVPSVTTPA
jgi:hypothetical protein